MRKLESGLCRVSIFDEHGNPMGTSRNMAVVTDSMGIYPVITLHNLTDKTGVAVVLSDAMAQELIEHLTAMIGKSEVLQ